MPRTNYPSKRWYKRWIQSFVSHHGHNGPVTLSKLYPRAIELYLQGCTALAAGNACAQECRLYNSLSQHLELYQDQAE